ncbi:MAG: beta strand repeat-containing protein [Terrimicrobiaceae bacterium]
MKPLEHSAIRLVAISFLILAGSHSASAQNVFWNRTSGTNAWTTGANWTGGTPAGGADRAFFQNSSNSNQTQTITLDDLGTDIAVDRIRVDTSGAFTGLQNVTFSGARLLTVNGAGASPQIQVGSATVSATATFATNVTFGSGLKGVSALNSAAVINFNSGFTLTGALQATGSGTVNLNSTTYNAGANATALRVDAGTVNWNVGTFTTTTSGFQSALFYLAGTSGNTLAAPATLNMGTSLNNSNYGITLANGAANTSNNVALYGTANGVTIAGQLTMFAAGTSGSAVNNVIVGANDTAATAGSPSTVTFSGLFAADTTSANSRTYQFFAADNNTAVFSGVIQGGNASASNLFKKTGAGTVTFSGASANTYNSLISTEVVAGTLLLQKSSGNALTSNSVTVDSGATLRLGASNQISNTSALTLSGGTFAAQSFSDTLGTLTLSGNSFISLSGGTLAFADSSAATWGAFTLDITGFASASSLRFGTNSSGLSASQLLKFTASGFNTFGLDSNGYLTAVPEPTSIVLLAFGLTTVTVLRRRRS